MILRYESYEFSSMRIAERPEMHDRLRPGLGFSIMYSIYSSVSLTDLSLC